MVRDMVRDMAGNGTAGFSRPHRLIVADAGMVEDQVAAPDDAATVTQLFDTDHARIIEALEHLVGPTAGTLQAFPERGLTHAAPADPVGIGRQNSKNGDFISADILVLAPGSMHDPIAAPSSLMAHGNLHEFNVGSRRQRKPVAENQPVFACQESGADLE
jgi:hypothetical protein